MPNHGKILVVMTNHSEYPTRSDTTGLWLTELTHFIDVVQKAGYETVFTSPKGGKVPLDERSLSWLYMDTSASNYLKTKDFLDRLDNTLPIADIKYSQFSAIYFTGGHGVMWDFKDNPDLKRAAEAIYTQGGVLSAVCHGVAGLINLEDEAGKPLIEGRKITGFSNLEEFLSGLNDEVPFHLQDELENKGASYKQSLFPFFSYSLTDGRIITGQNPASAKAVAVSLVKSLSQL
ncbi:MAG: type 1 glutamine amidotransferase domain-containing protein [Pseudomonadales bacterium]|nr:type 1 glutamine amidotransferase domain-containing protein [Pseudomonadales bacterium]